MQERMRDNNQVLRRKLVADGCNQQRIQFFQVRLRGFQQGLFQRLDIFRSQTELGQLQL